MVVNRFLRDRGPRSPGKPSRSAAGTGLKLQRFGGESWHWGRFAPGRNDGVLAVGWRPERAAARPRHCSAPEVAVRVTAAGGERSRRGHCGFFWPAPLFCSTPAARDFGSFFGKTFYGSGYSSILLAAGQVKPAVCSEQFARRDRRVRPAKRSCRAHLEPPKNQESLRLPCTTTGPS